VWVDKARRGGGAAAAAAATAEVTAIQSASLFFWCEWGSL